MRIQQQGDILNISGLRELSAANAHALRDGVAAAFHSPIKAVDIDLSEAHYVDGWGMGVLVSLYKKGQNGNGGLKFRLLHPTPPVQQLFELARMHHLFEIVPPAVPVTAEPRNSL